MKLTKQGKIRLEKGEVRIGNFFIRDEGENEHIRLTDLNSCFTLRVWKRMPIGIWLDNMLKNGDDGKESLKTYIAMMWSSMAVAPDNEFVADMLKCAESALKRHPDWYGSKGDATPDDDKEAQEEVEGMMALENEVKEKYAGDGNA